MTDLKHEDNKRKQMYAKLQKLFEKVQTMRHMNYNYRDMVDTLEEQHPDFVYFVNNYLEAQKGKDLEEIIRKAYRLLYSEEPPILRKKEDYTPNQVPDTDGKIMLERCTERLLRYFIRCRVELVVELLCSGRFNAREFAALGYDREYMNCLLHTVKLFSPTCEIKREMLHDKKLMDKIISRIFEDAYILTKRTRVWTCDWLDFEGLKTYGEVK